jgi:cytochrome c oxidase subunit 4
MEHHPEKNAPLHVVPVSTYVLVWVALMIGTISTYLIAEYVDVGPWNIVIALVIAGTKMSLVIYFFMHVKFDDPLTRLFVGGGFFWLLILIALTLGDYESRGWLPISSFWHR